MKHIKFKTSEDIFTYLKTKIGFENLEQYLNTLIETEMEHQEHEQFKTYSKPHS